MWRRQWSEAATGQGTLGAPRVASHKKGSSLEPSQVDTLTLDVWSPELSENKFLWF